MFINSLGFNEIDDDDLFTRPPRAVARAQAAQQARITCRVCRLGVLVTLDNNVLLCDDCRRDPKAKRAEVATWLAGVDAQEQTAFSTWQTLAATHADYWAKIVAAGHTPATDARARAAHPTYAALLDAEATYLAACVPLQAERARLSLAIQELDSI